jgi:hypothetical protein
LKGYTITPQIYHYHIPKTGGIYIVNNLKESGFLNTPNLSIYQGTEKANFDYLDYKTIKLSNYIHGHFGIEPLDIIDNLLSYTTLRNPVTRVISHFSMIYFPIKTSDIMKVFNRWVHNDDVDYLVKNNLQSRFLTNSLSKEYIKQHYDVRFSTHIEEDRQYWKDGFAIDIKDPTYEAAKNNLNKVSVVGKMEYMDEFMNRLYTFINDKFKTNLIYNNIPEPKNHKRFSKLSKYIQNNIQASEVKKLTDLNTIDMNLWESID